MSIEQKIAELLAESKAAQLEEAKKKEMCEDEDLDEETKSSIVDHAVKMVAHHVDHDTGEDDDAPKKIKALHKKIETSHGKDVADAIKKNAESESKHNTTSTPSVPGGHDEFVKKHLGGHGSPEHKDYIKKMNKNYMDSQSQEKHTNESTENEFKEEAVKPAPETPNPDNARNNVDKEKEAEGGTSKKANRATQGASAPEASHLTSVKEDVDALLNGENLSEEFKQKATTIFEAAVTTRVKAELSRIEEEYNSKLQEAAEEIKEGLVEQVDGYLGYIAEQWIAQNEIALERGIKSEILEGFISGMKDLFVEHYIDIPEEKYDLLGSLEEQVETLETKLNEQVATNIELAKTLAEQKRVEIVKEASEGLTDTEIEKFTGLVEELSYEDYDTFKNKVTTIRENYFNTKAQADVKSVVTDTPVETLTEEKKLDPAMSAYMSMLNRK